MSTADRFLSAAAKLCQSARTPALALVTTLGAPVAMPATQTPHPFVAPATPHAPAAAPNRDWPQTGREWTMLDRDVDQRLKRLTQDEMNEFLRRAKAGSPLAQTMLGLIYREGASRSTLSGTGPVGQAGTLRHGQLDNGAALQWFFKAAAQGFPMSQVELGEMYYRGHGVERDIDQAIAWTEKAAATDYPRAQLNLVQMKLYREAERSPEGMTPEALRGLGREAADTLNRIRFR